MATLFIESGFKYTDSDGNVCTVTGRHFDDYEITTATVDDEGYEHPTGKTYIVTKYDIMDAVKQFSGKVYDRISWNAKYRVLPEYFSEWGSNVDENTIITEDEVERLADEWEIDEDDLKQQLTEI